MATKWANFLHLYQPYYQQPDVLARIVGVTYRPLIEGLAVRPELRMTLNVNGVLLELFESHGYADLTEKLAALAQSGQIELLGSAKFHTLLPFLPAGEVLRQIDLNGETCRRFLGAAYQPRGLYLPEMAWDPKLASLIERAGFEYVLLDELAHDGHAGSVDYGKRYVVDGSGLVAWFRQRRISNAVMQRALQSLADVKAAVGADLGDGKYLVTGMDGEVFGNWYPGYEQFLFEMHADKDLGLGQLADLMDTQRAAKTVKTVACSWADSERDLEAGTPFFSWRDPDNQLQAREWELQQLAISEFARVPEDHAAWPALRAKLDPALASDVFFWSSARPWWSIELIEEGAYGLMDIVESSPTAGKAAKDRAGQLYREIMDTAFWWRRSGKIAAITSEREQILRIPFRDRASGGSYEGFLHLLRDEEHKAAAAGNYEAAALWRDAAFKLENRRDVYDAYHVIDMLRARLPNEKIEAYLQKYERSYQHIRGGQPEQRSN